MVHPCLLETRSYHRLFIDIHPLQARNNYPYVYQSIERHYAVIVATFEAYRPLFLCNKANPLYQLDHHQLHVKENVCDVVVFILCFFTYVGCYPAPRFFWGGAMSKTVLIMLGVCVIFVFIVILMAAIDEYLHGHDSCSLVRSPPKQPHSPVHHRSLPFQRTWLAFFLVAYIAAPINLQLSLILY